MICDEAPRGEGRVHRLSRSVGGGHLGAFVLIGMFALVLAGCRDGSARPEPADPSSLPASPVAQSAAEERSTQRMTKCLVEAGFLVTVATDGRLEIESPAPGVSPREAVRTCQEKLITEGVLPDPNMPPSRADLEDRYNSMLGIHECMQQHGFPTEEPPSLDVYIEGGGVWHPYFVGPKNQDGLSPTPAVDFEALQRDCPER